MSGIAGIVGRNASERRARLMASSLSRADDHVDAVALGDAAIGVAGRSAPFAASIASSDGVAAGFAGVLDNAEELMPGGASQTPAQLLVALWRRGEPEELLSRMRGVYSAVVTDGRRLWAWRDHVGFSPLFHHTGSGATVVASEAKTVAIGAEIDRAPDTDVVEAIFYGHLGTDDRCALRSVRRLGAATLLSATPEASTSKQYWQPEALLETANLTHDELHDRFELLMDRAVRRTLTGNDVVSFSGGYDSPAVAAYAAPATTALTGRSLAALSLVYPDLPTVDEREFIEPAAAELGLDLHMYSQIARPLDDIDDWVRRFDGPVAVISLAENYSHLSKALELGFTTMLTGDFAEFVADERVGLMDHLIARGHWLTAARHIRTQIDLGVPTKRALKPIARTVIPSSVRRVRRGLRREHGRPIPRWVDDSRVPEAPIVGARQKWREEQLNAFRGPGLSLEADAFIQDYAGVRTRRPWADIDLWEFFLSLPAHEKFPNFGRKYLLRDLLRGRVPDVILDRTTKTVFDASIVARIDYTALETLLRASDYRMPGVDYDELHEHITNRSLDIVGFMWAKDLVAIHSFMSMFA